MDISTFGVARILANAIPGSAAKRAEDAAAAAESAAELLQPPATDSDVGKALIAKTVEDGKVTEYEYGEAGGGTVTDVQVNGTSVVADGVANIDADDLGITQTVTNWLGQHVDPDTGYVIDDTLSIAGAAADAKAVGDELADLNSAIEDVDNELYPIETKTLHYADITWHRGYLKSDGTEGTSASFMVSAYLPVVPGGSVAFDGLRSPDTIYPALCGYDSAKNHVSNSNVFGDDAVILTGTYIVPSGVAFIKVSTYNYGGMNKFNSIAVPVEGNRIDNINNRMTELEEELPMYQYTLGFDDYEYTTGKLASKDGEQTRTDGQVTNYISTENMLSVSVSNVRMVVMGESSRVAVVACYDSNKNLLQDKTVFADGTYGQFVQVTASVTITSEIAYVRLSRLGGTQNTGTFTITMERTLANDYNITKAEVADIEEKMNPWNGKNWFVFGTSMSDDNYPNTENDNKPTGVFPKYLEAVSGMKQFNHGIAGGTISTDPTAPYHPTGQIYTEITNTDFSTADLITLEGFINDFAEGVTLGNLGDTTQDTFYGALYLCIKYLSEHNTSATIVVITDPVGKEYTFQHGSGAGVTVDYSSTRINAIGLRQVDYNNAIIKTCQWMGVHCIDVGGESQINEYHPDYIVDQCHQTELGGKQFALTVWEKLKNIHCNDDVVIS